MSQVKKILFNSQFFWPRSVIELSLATALRLRGHDVKMLACGGLPEYCELESIFQERPSCDKCLAMVISSFENFQLPYLVQKDYLTEHDISIADNHVKNSSIDKLLTLQINDVPVGKLAWLNQYTYFRAETYEIKPEREAIIRRFVHSGILFTIAKARLLEDYQPDVIVTVNGKFLQWAPIIHLAKQRGIPYITWEDVNFHDSAEIIFAINDLAHEQRLDAAWEVEKDKPLSPQSKQQIYEHFKLWKEGKNPINPYYKETHDWDDNAVREQLGLRKNAPLVSMYPNVNWDSSSIERDLAFSGLYDWIFNVVNYARKRPDMDFVIRAHPAERLLPDERKLTTTPINEEVERLCAPVPSNVKLVDGADPLPSNVLGALSDVVIVYTSTLGMEFALTGKQPWVAGSAYYAGKGFTLDIQSPKHLFDLLDKNEFNQRLTGEQVELAERFAHMVRFRRLVKFPYQHQRQVLPPADQKELGPGSNQIIENLCSFILTGEPLLDLETANAKAPLGTPGQGPMIARSVQVSEDLQKIKELASQQRYA